MSDRLAMTALLKMSVISPQSEAKDWIAQKSIAYFKARQK
jgi:hypothetical protein